MTYIPIPKKFQIEAIRNIAVYGTYYYKFVERAKYNPMRIIFGDYKFLSVKPEDTHAQRQNRYHSEWAKKVTVEIS
jgi:hypothetical protein